MTKYIPQYKKGQLRVLFKEDVPEEMAEYIIKKLGYEIIPTIGFNWYTLKVLEETKAKKELKKYSEFIEWIERRDLLFEKRNEFISNLEDLVKSFDDSSSKKEFFKIIDKIKNKLDLYKED